VGERKTYPSVDENGMVHAHQAPGLGVEFDFDLIQRNKEGDLQCTT